MIPLGFASRKLQTASYKLQTSSCKPQATSLKQKKYIPESDKLVGILNAGNDLDDLLDVLKSQK